MVLGRSPVLEISKSSKGLSHFMDLVILYSVIYIYLGRIPEQVNQLGPEALNILTWIYKVLMSWDLGVPVSWVLL